jgi:exodeoxyribonuclease VII large subunit
MTIDIPERRILSVTELNRSVRQLLESNLPTLWVEGEISNLARPSSGHWYLTLKDQNAQVRCAMFKNANMRINFTPSNGVAVVARCKAGLYEGRGEYQLIIEHMEQAGFGALQRQFDALKKILAEEGLFDQLHKQSLPRSIQHIGMITSPTGAAVKDILSVLKRRFPAIRISLFPAAVQGEQAASQITQAIKNANDHGQCDVLIVGRGGGSLEDLWPFNEEIVARAIFESNIPIVSAVGHEIDFTIADFVADLRAPTPSAAAELTSPDSQDISHQLIGFEDRLKQTIKRRVHHLEQRTEHLQKRLQHPGRKLQQQAQHLDHIEIRLGRAMASKLQQHRGKLQSVNQRLARLSPETLILNAGAMVAKSIREMIRTSQRRLQDAYSKTQQTLHLLDTVSPLKTLERGYSVIRNEHDSVIKSVTELSKGERLRSQLSDGEIIMKVTDINQQKL